MATAPFAFVAGTEQFAPSADDEPHRWWACSPVFPVFVLALSKRKGNALGARSTHRPTAGNSRSPHFESCCARAAARLGYFRAIAANFKRCCPGATGVALSGAPSIGTAWLAAGQMGYQRKQSSSQVLRTHGRGAQAIGAGIEILAQTGRSHRRRIGYGVAG